MLYDIASAESNSSPLQFAFSQILEIVDKWANVSRAYSLLQLFLGRDEPEIVDAATHIYDTIANHISRTMQYFRNFGYALEIARAENNPSHYLHRLVDTWKREKGTGHLADYVVRWLSDDASVTEAFRAIRDPELWKPYIEAVQKRLGVSLTRPLW
jgi:Trp operon repressor